MTKHTVNEACLLTKKCRKTLYSHMASGKISYGVDVDGKRFLETSELIRVYGNIKLENEEKNVKYTCNLHENKQKNYIDYTPVFNAILNEIRQLNKKIEALSETKFLPAPQSPPIQKSEGEQTRDKRIITSLANLRKKIKK